MLDPLVGSWSSDVGYYSSMEDDWLMLRADGTGWYAFLRPGRAQVVRLKWKRLGATRIRAETIRRVVVEGDDTVVEVQELFTVEEVDYAIVPAQRPLLDEPADELRVELSFAVADAFVRDGPEEPEADFLRAAGVQA